MPGFYVTGWDHDPCAAKLEGTRATESSYPIRCPDDQ
jgi:hypothetical protein